MMKSVVSITVCMILATVLGVYGQWIAYFMSENHPLNATYYLTACTVLSMLLYAVSMIISIRWVKLRKIKEWISLLLFLVISLIAVPISVFSFFATVMWWG